MNIFGAILKLLETGESVVLATVLTRSGSAPRSPGARMVVHSDGHIGGTVGGGVLEAGVLEAAKEVFAGRNAVVREFDFTDGPGRAGMTCGGRVRVLLHFLDASVRANLDLYSRISTSIMENGKIWLVSRVPEASGACEKLPQWILGADGSVMGVNTHCFPDREEFLLSLFGERHGYLHFEGDEYHIEALFNRGTAFIFGAGHVGRALARLTPMADFKTLVLDDRREFADRERLGLADRIFVLDSFENAMENLQIDEESYIVVVTRGHAHDETVLRQALETGAGYIGMIGSRKKREAVYKVLAETGGFSEKDFARVHSPIGLNIGAETPEEIAVSILAEMIRVRAGKSG